MKYLSFTVSFLLAGCISTGPDLNLAFTNVKNINEFVGLYKNHGDSGEESSSIYLSKVIWPNDENLVHEKINTVRVAATETNSLIISALTHNGSIKEQEYIEGRDFKINGGRVTITREGGIAGFKSGEPLLGVYHGSNEIGIDIEGNAKYRSSGSAAGLVFMVIPIVARGEQNVRFERLE